MKIISFIFILILFSCSNKKTENRENITNLDSIKYEFIKNSKDYQDFSEFVLNNPNSCFFFEALEKYNKMRNNLFDSLYEYPIIECWRNCATIGLNTKNEIAYEGNKISLSTLHDSLISFFINANDNQNLPVKKIIEDKNKIPHEISTGQVELQYVNDSCSLIQDVIIEISKSIDSYKNYLSKDWYSKEFSNLSLGDRNLLDSLLRYRIILYGFDREYILPPLQPDDYKYDK